MFKTIFSLQGKPTRKFGVKTRGVPFWHPKFIQGKIDFRTYVILTVNKKNTICTRIFFWLGRCCFETTIAMFLVATKNLGRGFFLKKKRAKKV